MPCKQGNRENIEASKEFYRKQKEYDPYRELWNSLVDRAYKDDKGYENLTENEKIYFYIGILDGEVYNGGMHQYFSNSSGELYQETLEYLNTINAQATLALLKKAKNILFGSKPVPKEQSERNKLIIHENEWGEDLDLIDEEYYKDIDNIGDKMNQFAVDTGIIKPFLKDA
jgi:hypothetical protein